MIELDDDRLAHVLASVGDHLRVEPTLAVVPRAATSRPRRVRRALAIAVAVLVPLVAVVLAIAPLRHTVADWLGIGSTRVIFEPAPTSAPPAPSVVPTSAPPSTSTLPGIVDGLAAIDTATAESLLGWELPVLDRTSLGAPSGFARMPEGGVLVVWSTGETLWIHGQPMPAGALFDKLVASSESVERVDDLGDDALVVSGDHLLRTPHRTIDATTTVLWVDGERELRLEGDHLPDDLVAIAREFDASG